MADPQGAEVRKLSQVVDHCIRHRIGEVGSVNDDPRGGTTEENEYSRYAQSIL